MFVLLVVGGLGIFFYRHFGGAASARKSVEKPEPKSAQGIKQSAEDRDGTRVHAHNSAEVAPEKMEPKPEVTASDAPAADEPDLHARIVALVAGSPGMLQTEIYASIPEEKRKALQTMLLQMDRSGSLKREREGSSYRLFVV